MKAEKAVKPPLGVMSKRHYTAFLREDIDANGGMSLNSIRTKRLGDLNGAIQRYAEAKMNIDIKWINEYNDILSELGVEPNNFKL